MMIKLDDIFVNSENELFDYITNHYEYNLQFNFSGGKDSSAIVGMILSLIKQGKLGKKQTHKIIIYHSDTTIESPLFTKFTQKVLKFFEDCGLRVIVGRADVSQRLFAQIFAYGKPIPNHSVRWCTDNLKIKLAEQTAKRLGDKTIIFTGEHVGESSKRDNKLSKLSANTCGSSECGSDKFKEQRTKNKEQLIHRPIHNWRTCQVWEYLQYLDYCGVINFYKELAEVYKIANDTETNKSLRMGCVGCPVISIKNHYNTFDKGIPNYLSLKLSLIFEEMRNDSLRLKNPKRFLKGDINDKNGGYGALALESRKYYWEEIKKLNEQMQNIGFDMISKPEQDYIEESLSIGRYPITYHKTNDIIPLLEAEWNQRKPSWIN